MTGPIQRTAADVPVGVQIAIPGEFLRVEDASGHLSFMTREDGEQMPTLALELVAEPFAAATDQVPQISTRTYIMTQAQWLSIQHAINEMFV